ncbi:MAG: hypothetical protein PHG67_10965 [Bacteroidales bacterium]|nr:hypothetical protein [Bacteroidales bacterium]HOI32792.1 hypothetical protein [Bacteroidales bacterium]
MAAKSKTSRKKSVKKSGKKKKKPAFLISMIILGLVLIVGVIIYHLFVNSIVKDIERIFTPVIEIFSSRPDTTNLSDETTFVVEHKTVPETAKPDEPIVKTALEGTWVSTINGAMLSFEGNRFKLEFPSIEERTMFDGHFKLINSRIHLVNTLSDDLCGMENGTYRFNIKGEDLILEAENDPCKLRKENLNTDWFKL